MEENQASYWKDAQGLESKMRKKRGGPFCHGKEETVRMKWRVCLEVLPDDVFSGTLRQASSKYIYMYIPNIYVRVLWVYPNVALPIRHYSSKYSQQE